MREGYLKDLIFANNYEGGKKFLREIDNKSRITALYVIGSTRTSTIPGISVAGASPEATLYTPALDVEYLTLGRTVSMKGIPVTPEGIPTPAVLTRAVLKRSGIPFGIVDAGSYLEPKVPRAVMPSREVGGKIDEENALREGMSRKLFEEGRILSKSLLKNHDLIIIGESIPGGTTTALGIMISLGYEAWDLVSSAGPVNPLELKRQVVAKGLERCRRYGRLPSNDPFVAVDCLGDPVHVTMAGIAYGCIEEGVKVLLAGGTQMGAVLAILKKLNTELANNIAIGTTRWIIEDKSSNIVKIIKLIDESVPVIAFNYDFSNSPFDGLRYYEKGYVKEGVGAGGTAIIASVSKGLSKEEIIKAVYEEYGALVRGEKSEGQN
jgi:uncharacterized protein (TIGR00303 family)